LRAEIELFAISRGTAVAQRQHRGRRIGGADVLEYPLHDQPARTAAQHNASIHAPDAGRDHCEFLVCRRAIIRRAIIKSAQFKGRQPLYLFKLCRVPETFLRETSLGIAKVFIIMIESSKGKMF
jgi:hypothetical protein